MLMGALALLVLASVPLAGGQLRRLGDLSFRGVWLPPLALALQVLVINIIPTAPHAFVVTVHLATYALAAVFVWRNRAVHGLVLLVCGGAMNGVTIAANGGTLPASADALRRAGLEPDPSQFTNSGVLEDPRLAFLGDNYAVPAGWPLANVFSLGDVVIVVALVYAVHRACRVPRPVAAPVPVLETLTADELRVELTAAYRAAAAAVHRQRELADQLRVLRRGGAEPVAALPADAVLPAQRPGHAGDQALAHSRG